MTARLSTPPRPACGPYARVLWDRSSGRWVRRLTAEGRRLAAEYVALYEPAPARVLEGVCPGTLHRAARLCGWDEVHQAARMGVALAVARWRPAGGASLVTVATWGIKGAVADLARQAARWRRGGLVEDVFEARPGQTDYLSDVDALFHLPAPEPPESWPAGEWDAVLAPLDPVRRGVVLGRVRDGLRLQDIGAVLGRTDERVRQLYVSARRTLREAFPDWCEGGEGVVPAGGLRGGLGR